MNAPLRETRDVRDYSFAQLREICQKTSSNPAQEGLTGRIIRSLSLPVTAALLRTRISPNQVTILGVLVFFAGMALFFVGAYAADVFASVLIFLSVILDAADGEVARFRGSAGRLGSNYVEPVSHDVQYGISFLLLGGALFLRTGNPLFLLLGSIASTAKLLFRLFESRFWQYYHAGITKEKIEQVKQEYSSLPLYARFASWFRRRWYSSTGFAIESVICALLGRLDLLLWFWAVGASVFCVSLAGKQFWRIARNPGP